MKTSRTVAFAVAALFAVSAPTVRGEKVPADLIIINAHVWTVDDLRPEAQALAVRGERIAAVGTTTEVQTLAGPATRVIDAGGRLVLPGLHDNHTHFIRSGMEVGQLDLKDAASPDEFGRKIAEYAATRPEGEWVTGGNWDHDKFPGGELPTAELIDRYVADRPVLVSRFDGHMAVANSMALRLGNVTSETTDPVGGMVVRKPGGQEPAGVLKEGAMSFVSRVIPSSTPEHLADGTRKAFAEARRFGLTTIHDMLDGERHNQAYKTVRDEGGMTARIYGRWPISDWRRLAKWVAEHGPGDDLFQVRGVKAFTDGSIGSSTALFFQPYADDPNNRGLASAQLGRLKDWCLGADAAGLQLCLHAIGDHAIYETLDIFEVIERTNGTRDRRPRIEHDQHTHPRDFRRHVDLGVIASVQPYHAIDDGRFVDGRIGRKRVMSSYAFRTFIDEGVRMCFGSDWNVAPLNPMLGIDAAVNRRTLDGKHPEGWYPEQKITVAEAIRAYTLENAYAAFMEGKTGSITPGKYADIIMLDTDLLKVSPDRIKDAQVDLTLLGGKVVHER